jgi:3-methyladenine DNA glycosylase AlkD
MNQTTHPDTIQTTAAAILADIEALPTSNTPNLRNIRKAYTKKLKNASPEFILNLALELLKTHRWFGYELVANHPGAFNNLTPEILEKLGARINSWWTVDAFGRTLTGPAWLQGLVSDGLIEKWALSDDLWWRRTALVSTVALNMRSHGGYGDTTRTLAVCRILVDDYEDMVVKALSWALRALVPHDPEAVADFQDEYASILAARVKREVRNKLTTGLKNPR